MKTYLLAIGIAGAVVGVVSAQVQPPRRPVVAPPSRVVAPTPSASRPSSPSTVAQPRGSAGVAGASTGAGYRSSAFGGTTAGAYHPGNAYHYSPGAAGGLRPASTAGAYARPGSGASAPHGFAPGAQRVYSASHYSFHGRSFAAVRAPAYRYSKGYGYRVFRAGERFPAALLLSPYFIADYYLYNLTPPGPGLTWVRFGPDALLVNTYNGAVIDSAPGVFDTGLADRPPPQDYAQADPEPPTPQAPTPEVDADGTSYPGPAGVPGPSF